MTICDLCGNNVPTNVCAFGRVAPALAGTPLPTWDLCEYCEKKILIKISSFIDGINQELDDKDYLINKKYNAD